MESRARRPQMMRGRASPFDEHEKPENLAATRRRIIGYFSKEKFFVGGIFAAIVAAIGFDLAVPALQSRAIDVIAGQSSEPFFPVLWLMLGCLVISLLILLLAKRLKWWISKKG